MLQARAAVHAKSAQLALFQKKGVRSVLRVLRALSQKQRAQLVVHAKLGRLREIPGPAKHARLELMLLSAAPYAGPVPTDMSLEQKVLHVSCVRASCSEYFLMTEEKDALCLLWISLLP